MTARKSAEDRSAEILQAALSLAFELGPERVTTGKIADRLGLTQPAIYRHFKNKEAIWHAVADQLCARIAENTAGSADMSLTAEARLRKLVLGHLQLIRQYPALPEIMVMRTPSQAQTASRSQIRTRMEGFRAALVVNIREARDGGRFRPDISANDAATLVFGIIQGLVLRLLLTRNPEIMVTEGARLLDLQLSLLTRYGDHL